MGFGQVVKTMIKGVAAKDTSALYEVERRAYHAVRPGFRIAELQRSSTQKVPWHTITITSKTRSTWSREQSKSTSGGGKEAVIHDRVISFSRACFLEGYQKLTSTWPLKALSEAWRPYWPE